LSASPEAKTTITLTREVEQRIITIPGADQYQLMVEHFADCAIAGRGARWSAADGRATLRVIEALLESARMQAGAGLRGL